MTFWTFLTDRTATYAHSKDNRHRGNDHLQLDFLHANFTPEIKLITATSELGRLVATSYKLYVGIKTTNLNVCITSAGMLSMICFALSPLLDQPSCNDLGMVTTPQLTSKA